MASSRRLRSSIHFCISEDGENAIQNKQEVDPLAITDEHRKAFREKEMKKENKLEGDPLAITDEHRKAFREKEMKKESKQEVDSLAITDEHQKAFKEKEMKQECPQNKQEVDPLAITDEHRNVFREKEMKIECYSYLEKSYDNGLRAIDFAVTNSRDINSMQNRVDEAFEGMKNLKSSPVKISNELLECFGEQLLNGQPVEKEKREEKFESISTAGLPVNSNALRTMALDFVNENISLRTEKTQINLFGGSPVNLHENNECNVVYEKISPKIEKNQDLSEGNWNGIDADDTSGSLIMRGHRPSTEFEEDEEINSFNDCVFKCRRCGKEVSQSEFSNLRSKLLSKNEFGKCVECFDWVSKICLGLKESCTSNDQRHFKCNICQKKFKHKHSLAQHKLGHIHQKSFECEICSQKFREKASLKSHKFIHYQEKPHKCTMCPKSFVEKNTLIGHLRTHTGDKPYKCDICSKSFPRKGSFSRHLLIHSSNKLKCETCLYDFSDKDSLKRHIIRRHTREFPHNCATCGKGFLKPYALEDHIKLHTGDRNFVCDVCGKSYFTDKALKNHMFIHTDEKSFTCDICSKTFNSKNKVKRHISTHSSNKLKYQCDKCSKFFSSTSNLRDHMLHHSEERKFQCNICKKAFKFKHHLGNHMHTHSNI